MARPTKNKVSIQYREPITKGRGGRVGPETPADHQSSSPTLEDRFDASLSISNDDEAGYSAPSQDAVPSDIRFWSLKDNVVYTFKLAPEQSTMINSTITADPRLFSDHHAFHLPLDIDIKLLQNCWEVVSRGHDMLRTSFHPDAECEGWIGAIHGEPKTEWNIVDLCFVEPPEEVRDDGKSQDNPHGEKEPTSIPEKKPIPPKKTKGKKRNRTSSKYVDKRKPRNEDDFMENPALYESFDRKPLTEDESATRINLDSGNFWDLPSSEDEIREELQQVVASISYPDASSFARSPVQVHILKNEEQVVFLASLHQVVVEGKSIEPIFEELWRLYIGKTKTTGASTPFWLNRIKGFHSVAMPPVDEGHESDDSFGL